MTIEYNHNIKSTWHDMKFAMTIFAIKKKTKVEAKRRCVVNMFLTIVYYSYLHFMLIVLIWNLEVALSVPTQN